MGSAPTYRSVYPGMSEADRQEAKDALDAAGFAPRIDASTGSLQVADERYHEARILLASQDILAARPPADLKICSSKAP